MFSCLPSYLLLYLLDSTIDQRSCNPASAMRIVMDVRSSMRATLLALTFLWVGTSLPHMYSSAMAFFQESLPSIVSTIIAPKCLFVFSNIIVVFLVSESKLSRRRRALLNKDNKASPTDTSMLSEMKEEGPMAVTEALLPTFTGESNQDQESSMVMGIDEDKGSSDLNEGLQMHQCEEQVDHLFLHEFYEVQEEEEEEELILQEGLRGKEEQECAAKQEFQEMDLPPADELNRRVEDFIARFNMERQLEAKMLVCCY